MPSSSSWYSICFPIEWIQTQSKDPIAQHLDFSPGTLSYTASANTLAGVRSGTLNIGGLEYYISQSGAPTVSISPPAAAFYQQNSSPLTFNAKDGNGNPLNSNWSLSPTIGSITPSSGTSTGYSAPCLSSSPEYTYLAATDAAVPSSYATAAILLNYGTSGNGTITWEL